MLESKTDDGKIWKSTLTGQGKIILIEETLKMMMIEYHNDTSISLRLHVTISQSLKTKPSSAVLFLKTIRFVPSLSKIKAETLVAVFLLQ
jgi:hypothetical protein